MRIYTPALSFPFSAIRRSPVHPYSRHFPPPSLSQRPIFPLSDASLSLYWGEYIAALGHALRNPTSSIHALSEASQFVRPTAVRSLARNQTTPAAQL